MQLESQVCSLELAKRLKELGVKQESLFYYGIAGAYNKDTLELVKEIVGIYFFNDIEDTSGYYSAFTVAELIEMISDCFQDKKIINKNTFLLSNHLNSYKDGNGLWRTELQCEQTNEFGESFFDSNHANSLAKLRIYLIENKLMDVPK